MSITKKKAELIAEFGANAQDSGSSSVQVAIYRAYPQPDRTYENT